jgi:hypothetical protein
MERAQEQFTSSWTRLHRENILLRPDLEQNKRRITNKNKNKIEACCTWQKNQQRTVLRKVENKFLFLVCSVG